MTEKQTTVKKVGIIGAGTMGTQIAHLVALNGFDVVLKSRHQASLDSGLKRINTNIKRSVDDKRLSEQQASSAMARIVGTTSFVDVCKDCDVLIESIVEDLARKNDYLKNSSKYVQQIQFYCSNTSSLSIYELSTVIKKPERFVGLHFFIRIINKIS
jgi:3-hydroxybutyryl-CoA dehydrogenase